MMDIIKVLTYVGPHKRKFPLLVSYVHAYNTNNTSAASSPDRSTVNSHSQDRRPYKELPPAAKMPGDGQSRKKRPAVKGVKNDKTPG